MMANLDPDDIHSLVKWKGDRYMLANTDPENEESITKYRGPFAGWEWYGSGKLTKFVFLLDMVLYTNSSALEALARRLDNSTLESYDVVKQLPDILEDRVMLSTFNQLCFECVWTRDTHHWGKLTQKRMNTKTFVTGYLFRFINKLRHYENAVDNFEMLQTEGVSGASSYTTKTRQVWDYYDNYELQDGRKLDEFLVDEGFSEASMASLLIETDDISEMGEVARTCLMSLETFIKHHFMQENDLFPYKDSWANLLRDIHNMAECLLFGNWSDYVSGIKSTPKDSLAEYTLQKDKVGEELAKKIYRFKEKAERV